jgi:DNA repair photolyase
MKQENHLEVCVSYSWDVENKGQSKGKVTEFCNKLEKDGFKVFWDKGQKVEYGEAISEQMRHIGASDFLCVFLSDRYLRSPKCMYELLVAWQRSKDNQEEFRTRVKVWVMPSPTNILSQKKRDEYAEHWKKSRDKLKDKLDKKQGSETSPSDAEYFDFLKEISDKVPEILSFFAGNLQVDSYEIYLNWIQEQLNNVSYKEDSSSLNLTSPTIKITQRGEDQEPFQIWDQRAMISLGPISKNKHCYYSCPFCYVNTSEYKSFKRLEIADIIDWLKDHKGEYDIIYVSGDTDSFAGSISRQNMAIELIEKIESEFEVEIMITTRAIISQENLKRLKAVRDNLFKKGLFFYACVSISSYLQKDELEPQPIPSINARIEQLKNFKNMEMKTVLAMRPFLPIVPIEDYMSILERCKDHIDIVLGKEWYADEKGVLDNACKIKDSYQYVKKQMYFDTNIAYWKVYSPKEVIRKIREWCDRKNLKFFMTSRKAIDWVRASEPITRFPKVIGIGALNINFIPLKVDLIPEWLKGPIGEETEVKNEDLWKHVEKSYGNNFTKEYEVFLGGSAYHAIECLSDLDSRIEEPDSRNLELEFIGVAGKKIKNMYFKEMSGITFDIIEKLNDRSIGTKYVRRSESKSGITHNFWEGTIDEPQKAIRSNHTSAGANGELYDHLLFLMESDPYFVKHLAKADWIHVSSLFDHEAMSIIAELLTEAKKSNLGLRVSWDVGKLTKNLLDCKLTLREIFRASDFVILNEKELNVLAGLSSATKGPESNSKAASRLFTECFPEANSALVIQLETLDNVEFYWRYKDQLVSQRVSWDRMTESGKRVNVTAASAYLSAALIDSQLRPDLGFNMQLATNYGMELVWAKVTHTFDKYNQEFKNVRNSYIRIVEGKSVEESTKA